MNHKVLVSKKEFNHFWKKALMHNISLLIMAIISFGISLGMYANSSVSQLFILVSFISIVFLRHQIKIYLLIHDIIEID